MNKSGLIRWICDAYQIRITLSKIITSLLTQMIILLRSRVRRRIDEIAAALVCVAAVFVAVAVFGRRGKVFAAEGFAAGALLVRAAAAAAEARGRVGGGVPLGEGDGEGAVGRGGVRIFVWVWGDMCIWGQGSCLRSREEGEGEELHDC